MSRIFFSVSSTISGAEPKAIEGLSEILFPIYGVKFAITLPPNFKDKIVEVINDIEAQRQSWDYKLVVAIKQIIRNSSIAPNFAKNWAIHKLPKSWIQLNVQVRTSDNTTLEQWLETCLAGKQPPTATIELPFGLTFYVTAADLYPLVQSRAQAKVEPAAPLKSRAATA